jgi:hypothetical protein
MRNLKVTQFHVLVADFVPLYKAKWAEGFVRMWNVNFNKKEHVANTQTFRYNSKWLTPAWLTTEVTMIRQNRSIGIMLESTPALDKPMDISCHDIDLAKIHFHCSYHEGMNHIGSILHVFSGCINRRWYAQHLLAIVWCMSVTYHIPMCPPPAARVRQRFGSHLRLVSSNTSPKDTCFFRVATFLEDHSTFAVYNKCMVMSGWSVVSEIFPFMEW